MRKKTFLGITLLLLFAPEMMHAQSSMGDTASKFFGGMIEVFTVLNWLALAVVQTLLNPDFIFGVKNPNGIRPMEIILNQIWIVSRDIVNGIFAFMLLAFGIYMIIVGGEKGVGAMLKEKAPKFVIAVVLVNFSWFFPRVILDMANVGQAVIYQLPSLIDATKNPCIAGPGPDGYMKDLIPTLKDETADNEPCNFVWKVFLFPPDTDECIAVPAPPGCPRPKLTGDFPERGRQIFGIIDIYYTDWEKAKKEGKYDNGTPFPVSGADIVINGLAVNFAKMPQLARVEFDRARTSSGAHDTLSGKARAYVKFFIYLVFHALLSMAIGLILIAFAAVLLVRVAVIWLCVAFMPFIFVGYAWKGALGDLGHEKAPNIWQKFIKYALLPVFVAIPLSIGFTLLSFSGYLSAFGAASLSGATQVFGLNIIGITEIHELIWLFLTFGIIWAGTFSVLESDEFSAKIVGGIKGVGQTGMNIAKKSLLYAPVIPFPGMRSVGDMMDMGKRAGSGKGVWSLPSMDDIIKPRGGAGGGAPTPSAVQAAVSDRKDSVDFKHAIRDMNAARAGNDVALRESLHKLAEALAKSGHISKSEAEHVLTDRHVLKEVLDKSEEEGLIDGTEKSALSGKFDGYYSRPSAPRVNIGITLAPSMGIDGAKKESAEKAHGALHTGMDIEKIKQALSESKNDTSTRDDQKLGIQQVLDAIKRVQTTSAAKKPEELKHDLLAELKILQT